jgi:predicted nucleic acid-binding protein
MAALILDASVLVGLLDDAHDHHEQAVADVERADRRGDDLVAPASAYSECLVAFARARRLDDARSALAAMGIVVAPMTAVIAELAAELRATHDSLRLPDALVLATSRESGGKLLTYDSRLAKLAKRR